MSELYDVFISPVGEWVRGSPTSIAIAGNRLLAGSSAGTVDLWTIDAGPIPQPLAPATDQAIARVALSGNVDAALALSRDGTVRIWRVNGGSLLDDVESHHVLRRLWEATSACLTVEERVTLLAEDASAANEAYTRCTGAVAGDKAQ